MKTFHQSLILVAFLTLFVTSAWAQNEPLAGAIASIDGRGLASSNETGKNQKVVIVTGARFSYKLVQKWIDGYYKVNPDVQIIIDSRGSADPSKFDVLAEVYEPEEEVKKNREYINIGRYAILPVANSRSAFAKTYVEKGLTKELIGQIYFHDIFADNDKQEQIKVPYTIYTRLQKAGVPIVFTKYFGYEQKDIKGKAIAGADEHLLKAILRDSTGVSYLPLPLIYDNASKKVTDGLTVIPVDLNDNGRINDEEKNYSDLSSVIEQLEAKSTKELKNLPIGYIHVSIDKEKATPEAIAFLTWINEHGQNDLHDFGYLKPESSRFEKEKFEQFSAKHLSE